MSRSSNTAVCESRKLAHLTLSKGGRMARATPTSIAVDCFRLNLKFIQKILVLNLQQGKVLPTLQENAVMLLRHLVI